VPVYRQVVDQVRFLVASGLLLPGDELPSTRGLSAELGVNPMTVSKAYSLLEEEGVLARRPGLPSIVADRGPRVEEQAREDALAEVLAPAVVAAQQLSMSDRQALEVFRRALAQSHPPKEQSA